MNPPSEIIQLPLLPRELAAHTGAPAPSYRRLYVMVLEGLIPADRQGSRWFVARANLPMIAKLLGLAPAEAPRRRRPVNATQQAAAA